MSETNTQAVTRPAAPTRRTTMPLKDVKTLQEAFDSDQFMQRLKQALPRHMSPDRMLAVFIQSVQKTPKLAQVHPLSLVGAFLSLASVGLEPNTALQHAFLIPFEKSRWDAKTRQRIVERVDVNIVFGYQGLIELSYRSGKVRSIHCDVVWQHDDNEQNFRYHYGTKSELFHRPSGAQPSATELPRYAYMHANLRDDAETFEVMSANEVLTIRNASQGYRAAMVLHDKAMKEGWSKMPAGYTDAPWVKHLVPMMKKTAMRNGSKWLPKSIELAAALQLDELADRGSTDYRSVIDQSGNLLDGALDALTVDETLDIDLGYSAEGNQTVPAETAQRTEPEEQARQQQTTTTTASKPRGRPPKQPAAPQETRQAAPTTTTEAPQSTTESFSQWLVDEFGDMIGDAPYTNAMAFAGDLRKEAKRAKSVTALLEINAPAVEEAERANSAARQQIAEVRASALQQAGYVEVDQAEGSDGDDLTWAVVPKVERGSIVWPLYQKDLKASLATLDAPFVDAWTSDNLPTIQQAPGPQRLAIIKAVVDRIKELGAAVPKPLIDALAPSAPQATSTTVTDDDVWVEQTLAEVRRQPSLAAVAAMAAANPGIRERMDVLKTSRPDLYKRVMQETDAHVESLKQNEAASSDGTLNL